MLNTIAAISVGAAVGALLRYGLSLLLNAHLEALPLGTLVSNFVAAYLVGFAIAYFGSHASISTTWRLFIVTGFAGGLSTFSTFSAELLFLLKDGRLGWSLATLFLHVCGSLLMAALGMASASALRPQ